MKLALGTESFRPLALDPRESDAVAAAAAARDRVSFNAIAFGGYALYLHSTVETTAGRLDDARKILGEAAGKDVALDYVDSALVLPTSATGEAMLAISQAILGAVEPEPVGRGYHIAPYPPEHPGE